ncbi:uncharacterized protein LOC105695492 [Orussus abietinus]|uniref:uncharacterized protein LOC105695492 n=1 Tax=Orussus abietinus TaxID=222816 RepID=UPI000625260D|nr:uncharacterized protein LOC105695492 [Orussus abietinus]
MEEDCPPNVSDEDPIVQCERKLGEPPSLENVKISDNVAELIENGGANEDRLVSYDKYWIDKLQCMDETHTKQNKLDIIEAEKTLRRLIEFAEGGPGKACPQNRNKVKNCYISFQGKTLQCASAVQEFVECVDRMMYKAVHTDPTTSTDKTSAFIDRLNRR